MPISLAAGRLTYKRGRKKLMAEAFTTQDKKVKERPARKKLKFFAHYEPAELA